jgi:transcriptional regulator with XRE-family HTH domain
MKDLPQKIRRLRQLLNHSQKEVAKHLCISIRTYGKIESGEIRLSTERFGQIAAFFNCPPEAILADTPEEVYMQYSQKHV